MMSRKSILFVNPDYHYSFTLRDGFRARGWRADLFIGRHYPQNLLYAEDGIRFGRADKKMRSVWRAFYLLVVFMFRYDFFLIYNSENIFNVPSGWLRKIFGRSFSLDLAVARLLRKKIIYAASGCSDVELRSVFSKFDDGKVCGNCGWGEKYCNDARNAQRLELKKRYGNLFLGYGIDDSTRLRQLHLRYKSLDLKEWRPGLDIPQQLLLPKTGKLRVLHGYVSVNRKNRDRNIKGSGYIIEAVEKLKQEGLAIELLYLSDIAPKLMRFYQAQSDIVVEQLIYGWWGSTGIESMALGKPVVCYLRKEWKDDFLKIFPEYDSLPIVEANTDNIYEVLKKLILNRHLREEAGCRCRSFAERHFNVTKNCIELEDAFFSLCR